MINSELQGSFSVSVLRDGNEIKSLDRQNNLILANMMSAIGAIGNYLHVGTGNTPPAFNDTGLDNWLTVSPFSSWANSNSVLNGAVYEKESFCVFTFPVGAVVGNLAELGISGSNNQGVSFDTRALFKDGAGDPTTITVTAADQLVVTYYIKKYVSMTPVSAQVLSGGELIDYTIRPCISTSGRAGSNAQYPPSIYLQTATSNLFLMANQNNILSIDPVTFVPTTIDSGGVFSPEGTSSVILTGTGNEVEHTITFPVSTANFQLGSMIAVVASLINYALFQIEFDGPNYITKNNTETLTIKIKEIVNQVI